MRKDMKVKAIRVLLIALLAVVAGCDENILEPAKDNQQTMQRVLRDPAYAEGLLHSAYRHLPTGYSFSEVATDDAVSNDKNNAFMRMATGQWSPIYSPVSEWNDAYAAISHLNFLLSVAEDVEWSWQSENRNQLFFNKNTGEAYALRGYFYLRLLITHGGVAEDGELLGVPIVTRLIEVNEVYKLPRASYGQVLEQINSDFDKALELLPYTWHNNYDTNDSLRVMGVQSLGRIQGKIVTALKAKAALIASSPAYNNGSYNVSKAAEAAALSASLLSEIGGVAGLAADRNFYNQDTDVSNPDIFWRANFVNNRNLETQNFPPSLFGNGRVNPTQNLVDAFPMKNGYPIDHPSSGYDAENPYADRDPRLESTVVRHGTNLRGSVINVSPESPTLDGLNLNIYSTRTGYYLKKLLREDVNLDPVAPQNRRHFYTHMRYTEIFLNYAEAANEAWGPDEDPNGYGFTPRSILAEIRKRAGMDQPDQYLTEVTAKEDMRELIRNERRLELSFEGHRFWDIRRWRLDVIDQPVNGVSVTGGHFTEVLVENRRFETPKAFYGPIPQNEIIRNEMLIQNTGW